MIEVAVAALVLGLAAATTATAISSAARVQSRTERTDLATSLAAEMIGRAEALGCGLPTGYNAVDLEDLAARCVYDASEGASGLADVDFVAEREGYSFDVAVRMTWSLLRSPPESYRSSDGECERRSLYASGAPSAPADAEVDPAVSVQPTVLTRSVSVRSADRSGVGVELVSRQAVLPRLAPEDARLGLMVHDDELVGDTMKLTQTVDGLDYSYTLHRDEDGCVWFPYLAQQNYTLAAIDDSGSPSTTTSRVLAPLRCPDELSASVVCHRFNP